MERGDTPISFAICPAFAPAAYRAAIAFLALLGSVGAVEQDLVPLLPGTIRMFGFLLIWAGLLTVAGAFDTTEGRRERRR